MLDVVRYSLGLFYHLDWSSLYPQVSDCQIYCSLSLSLSHAHTYQHTLTHPHTSYNVPDTHTYTPAVIAFGIVSAISCPHLRTTPGPAHVSAYTTL